MLPKRISILLFYSILFSSLLYGCSDKTKKPLDIGDGGLLSGDPCSAPCFLGINPGVTTEEQALAILSSKLDVKSCVSWDTRNSGGDRGIRCFNIIGITFNDQNLVNGVGFNPSQVITLNDIIGKYGNPDGVFVTASGIDNTPPIVALLYFNTENMIVYLPEQNSTQYNLQPDILIESIQYLEQSDYLFNFRSAKPWKGYGKN